MQVCSDLKVKRMWLFKVACVELGFRQHEQSTVFEFLLGSLERTSIHQSILVLPCLVYGMQIYKRRRGSDFGQCNSIGHCHAKSFFRRFDKSLEVVALRFLDVVKHLVFSRRLNSHPSSCAFSA